MMYFQLSAWHIVEMRPLSEDLRKRIIAAKERGESTEEIAKRYNTSNRSVDRYWNRYRNTGSYASYKTGKPTRSILDPHKKALLKWIKKEPGLTLEQLCERLAKKLDVKISIPGLWIRLKSYGLKYKKNDIRQRTKAR